MIIYQLNQFCKYIKKIVALSYIFIIALINYIHNKKNYYVNQIFKSILINWSFRLHFLFLFYV